MLTSMLVAKRSAIVSAEGNAIVNAEIAGLGVGEGEGRVERGTWPLGLLDQLLRYHARGIGGPAEWLIFFKIFELNLNKINLQHLLSFRPRKHKSFDVMQKFKKLSNVQQKCFPTSSSCRHGITLLIDVPAWVIVMSRENIRWNGNVWKKFRDWSSVLTTECSQTHPVPVLLWRHFLLPWWETARDQSHHPLFCTVSHQPANQISCLVTRKKKSLEYDTSNWNEYINLLISAQEMSLPNWPILFTFQCQW